MSFFEVVIKREPPTQMNTNMEGGGSQRYTKSLI